MYAVDSVKLICKINSIYSVLNTVFLEIHLRRRNRQVIIAIITEHNKLELLLLTKSIDLSDIYGNQYGCCLCWFVRAAMNLLVFILMPIEFLTKESPSVDKKWTCSISITEINICNLLVNSDDQKLWDPFTTVPVPVPVALPAYWTHNVNTGTVQHSTYYCTYKIPTVHFRSFHHWFPQRNLTHKDQFSR